MHIMTKDGWRPLYTPPKTIQHKEDWDFYTYEVPMSEVIDLLAMMGKTDNLTGEY